MKNDNGVFATEEAIEPVKISVGPRDLYVYNAQEDAVWGVLQTTFGIKAKRTYTKRKTKTDKTDQSWGEDAKPKRTHKPKTEKELVAA